VWITFKEVIVSKAAQHFADMKRFYENGGYSQAKECYFLLMEEYRKSRKNKNDASAIYEFVKDAYYGRQNEENYSRGIKRLTSYFI
jgi:hypothetical protein